MTSDGRQVAVLAGGTVVLFAGALIGMNLVTASTPEPPPAPTCSERTVKVGEELTSNLVEVDVYNASQRSGLANRVSIDLQRRGFLAGQIGNSTSKAKVDKVTILADDPKDPRVRLVTIQFGKKNVAYAAPDLESDNVIVLIGDGYKGLVEAKTSGVTDQEIHVCVPFVTGA